MTRLNEEVVKILQMPDTRERLAAQGLEPVGGTPEQFAAYITSEVAKWSKVIKVAGITPD